MADELDVERERLHLLDEDLERLGKLGSRNVLALDDGLVRLDATGRVVGLDREDLLQNVACAVRVQRPDLHLAETLAAELGFTTERLLGDEAVGTGRAGVNLVVDHMRKLEHVGLAHGNRLAELLARAAIVEVGLARGGKLGDERLVELVAVALLRLVHAVAVALDDGVRDLLLGRAVENRRGHEEGTIDRLVALGIVIPAIERGPAQVVLEQLADVHTGGYAQRIEDDVDRRAIGHVGHVLDREHQRDDALVAVATGELVALLHLALLRDVHAHELVDSRGKLVTGGARELRDADDATRGTVRHLQGRVANLAGLLAEDGA